MPSENLSRMTPAVMQYLRIKKKYPNCVLLFRMGDFYETFMEDAKTISQDLQIVLTARGKGEKRVPLAGIPYHALEQYLKKLVEKGRRVAICEQLEDPKFAKGLVKRDVVRIITPGTIIEDSLLSISNNYIMCIARSGTTIGVSFADVSTGEFYTFEPKDVLEAIAMISPAEIISTFNDPGIEKRINELGIPSQIVNDLDFIQAKEFLLGFFSIATLEGFGIEESRASVMSSGVLLHYLVEALKVTPSHFSSIRLQDVSDYLEIDSTTLENLEILRSQRDGSEKNTLYSTLNFTRTPMGKRRLANWLSRPLKKLGPILERHSMVERLLSDPGLLDRISSSLSGVYDLERICTRIKLERANKRDLLLLRDSLLAIAGLAESDSISVVFPGFVISEKILFQIDLLNRSVDESNDPDHLVKKGYDSELDTLRTAKDELGKWLMDFEQKERDRTGIKTLKIRFNRVFGFFIEIPKSQVAKVPGEYIRKQTQVNSERYTNEELSAKETEITGIEERILSREKAVFSEVVSRVSADFTELVALTASVSEIDLIHSFAMASRKNDYVRPVMHESYDLILKECRHPVMERALPMFVPNDLKMDRDEKMFIITGPNMAGKSTIMRQACIAILMAHSGCFVPCKSARIPITDRLFSRIGARDDIVSGKSTFMVEMSETAKILNNATYRSFVILDEIGRGTSTYDGICLAWSIAEHLVKNIGSKALFATHYHQLNSLQDELKGVANYHVEVKEDGSEIVFTHRLVKGGTDRSYGIHVARLSGLPEGVIARARNLMELFEKTGTVEKRHQKQGQELGELKQTQLFLE